MTWPDAYSVLRTHLPGRHAGLELDLVEGHRVRFVVGCTQVSRQVAQKVSQIETAFQSGSCMAAVTARDNGVSGTRHGARIKAT